jgi:hypothetical protein
MSGGTISGNTASYGGGVCVEGIRATFAKQSGGIIYGSDASSTLQNTAYTLVGDAVYMFSRYRNSTVGEDVTLDSEKPGASGGWE